MVTIKITNQDVYSKKVSDVYTELMERDGAIYRGGISIDLESGDSLTFWGEHAPNDYEKKYGFILTDNKQ